MLNDVFFSYIHCWGLISGSLAILNCLLCSWSLPHKMINRSDACVVLTLSIRVSWVRAESGERSASLNGSPTSFLLCFFRGSQRVRENAAPCSIGRPLWSCLSSRVSSLLFFPRPSYFRFETVFIAKVSIAMVCLLKHFTTFLAVLQQHPD